MLPPQYHKPSLIICISGMPLIIQQKQVTLIQCSSFVIVKQVRRLIWSLLFLIILLTILRYWGFGLGPVEGTLLLGMDVLMITGGSIGALVLVEVVLEKVAHGSRVFGFHY
jgi:hypothetical protein